MPAIHEVATITSKGQITLPKPIRQALGVDYGGKVAFELIVIHSQRLRRWPKSPGQYSIGTGGQYWIGANTLRNPRKHAVVGKKSQPDKGWDFEYWWSWRELNPRPQAFFEQFYMRSVLIWFLATGAAQTHATPAASTLLSRPHPRYPGGDQPM